IMQTRVETNTEVLNTPLAVPLTTLFSRQTQHQRGCRSFVPPTAYVLHRQSVAWSTGRRARSFLVSEWTAIAFPTCWGEHRNLFGGKSKLSRFEKPPFLFNGPPWSRNKTRVRTG